MSDFTARFDNLVGGLRRFASNPGPAAGGQSPAEGGKVPQAEQQLSDIERQVVPHEKSISVKFAEKGVKQKGPEIWEMRINDGERDRDVWCIVGRASSVGHETDAYFFVDKKLYPTLEDREKLRNELAGEAVRGTKWIADQRLKEGLVVKPQDEQQEGKPAKEHVEMPRMMLFVGDYDELLLYMGDELMRAAKEGRNVLSIPDLDANPGAYKAIYKAVIEGGNGIIGKVLDRVAEKRKTREEIKGLTAEALRLKQELDRKTRELLELRDKKSTIADLATGIQEDPYRALGLRDGVITSEMVDDALVRATDQLKAITTRVAAARTIEEAVHAEPGPEKRAVVDEPDRKERFRKGYALAVARRQRQGGSR